MASAGLGSCTSSTATALYHSQHALIHTQYKVRPSHVPVQDVAHPNFEKSATYNQKVENCTAAHPVVHVLDLLISKVTVHAI